MIFENFQKSINNSPPWLANPGSIPGWGLGEIPVKKNKTKTMNETLITIENYVSAYGDHIKLSQEFLDWSLSNPNFVVTAPYIRYFVSKYVDPGEEVATPYPYKLYNRGKTTIFGEAGDYSESIPGWQVLSLTQKREVVKSIMILIIIEDPTFFPIDIHANPPHTYKGEAFRPGEGGFLQRAEIVDGESCDILRNWRMYKQFDSARVNSGYAARGYKYPHNSKTLLRGKINSIISQFCKNNFDAVYSYTYSDYVYDDSGLDQEKVRDPYPFYWASKNPDDYLFYDEETVIGEASKATKDLWTELLVRECSDCRWKYDLLKTRLSSVEDTEIALDLTFQVIRL